MSVEDELDQRHLAAQAAFSRRDIDAYRGLFSPSLAYTQLDGRVVDRDRLMQDVAEQFRRFSGFKSAYVRASLRMDGEDVTEVLEQTADLQATAFGFVRRHWRLERRGDYTWTRLDGEWVIQCVIVRSESLSAAGWRLGFGSGAFR